MANTKTNKTEETPEESKNDSEEELKDTSEKTEEDKDKSLGDEKEPKETKDEESTSEDTTKPEEAPPELTKDDIITILKTFSGVGQVIAERIYDSGIDSREKLATLTVEDLKKLPGIGQSMAKNVADGIESAISDFDEPEKKEPAAVKKEPGITSKAIGFVKGTFGKITGFFRGKQPKSKTEPTKKPEPGPSVKTTEKSSPEEKAAGGDLAEEKKASEELEVEEEAVKETYFPEVGTSADEAEPPEVPQEVTIEGEETEGELKALEDSEDETEIKPDQEPEEKLQLSPALESTAPPPTSRMEINLKNSSGLLIWFENTPNLSLEAGKLLFKAGYNNLEELKDAVVEDLTMINGISEEEAKTICEELQKL